MSCWLPSRCRQVKTRSSLLSATSSAHAARLLNISVSPWHRRRLREEKFPRPSPSGMEANSGVVPPPPTHHLHLTSASRRVCCHSKRPSRRFIEFRCRQQRRRKDNIGRRAEKPSTRPNPGADDRRTKCAWWPDSFKRFGRLVHARMRTRAHTHRHKLHLADICHRAGERHSDDSLQ